MNITHLSAVTLHLTVSTTDGVEIDSTIGKEPLQIIQGTGYIIDGLEKAITGMKAGEKLTVTVEPENAYGERVDGLMQAVPISMFEGIEVTEGMQFRAQTDDGEQSVIVLEVTDEDVIVDGNHPLAGITLNFAVEILDVREATQDEIDHGHVQTDGACDFKH